MSPYTPQSSDISEAVDRAMFDHLRTLTPVERLKIAARASVALRRLTIAGLRLRYPQASEEELFRRAGALLLGPEATRRFYGAAAEAWLS